MCLIIKTDYTKPIEDQLFLDFTTRNKDGFGFMWIEKNKIHISKFPKGTFDELKEKYEQTKEFNPWIHFRMRTHGEIDHENTHPYHVGWGIFLMHNGVVSSFKGDLAKSDTWHFINQFLKPLLQQCKNPHSAIRSAVIKHAIEEVIGMSNRMVLADRGGYVILNEKMWNIVENERTGIQGCLVSNNYAWSNARYKEPVKPTTVTYFNGPSLYSSYGHGKKWNSQTAQWEDPPEETPKTQLPLLTNNKYNLDRWKNNLFYDSAGRVWAKRKNKWTRREEQDAKLKEFLEDEYDKFNVAEQFTKDLNNYSKTSKIEDDEFEALQSEVEYKATEEEMPLDSYKQMLVKNWMNYKPFELASMVYTDPDEAAIVIHELVHNHSNYT